jgi:hypothetical protein
MEWSELKQYVDERVAEWRKQASLPQTPEDLQHIYIAQEVIYSDIQSKMNELETPTP